jgi:hypothetical protein
MEVSTMEEALPEPRKKGGLRTIPFIICKQNLHRSITSISLSLPQFAAPCMEFLFS